MMAAETRIKVKRDGPRGWHWITAASFDPSKHERFDPVPPPQDEAQPKKRGRPRTKPTQET